MLIITRIIDLTKKRGLKQSYVCEQLGLERTWMQTVKKQNSNISEERLELIADILNTTVSYLKGETDDPSPEKEKSPSATDGLTNFQSTILQLLECVPEDRQGELASLIESALKMSGLLK